MDDSGLTDGQRLMLRAQRVALGLADTGLYQAEEMLRRFSPEGRAQARRAREARAKAARAVGFAVIASALVLAGIALAGAPALAVVVIALMLVAACMLVAAQVRPQRVTEEVLVRRTPLRQLPVQASAWLADQKRSLPVPAARLTDQIGRRLAELEPQLARVSSEELEGEAVRKLLAFELPSLIEGWRGVPPSLRQRPRADGRTADADLCDGLKLIHAEVGRLTEQFGRRALDEVATQGRYLELKYRDESR